MSTPSSSKSERRKADRKLKRWRFSPRVHGPEPARVASPSTSLKHAKVHISRSQSQTELDVPRAIPESIGVEKLAAYHVRGRSQGSASIKQELGLGVHAAEACRANVREDLPIATPIASSATDAPRKLKVFTSRSYDALDQTLGWVRATRQYYSNDTPLHSSASCSTDNLDLTDEQVREKKIQSIRETLYGPQSDTRGRKRKGEFRPIARKPPPAIAMRPAEGLLKPPRPDYKRRSKSPVRRLLKPSTRCKQTGSELSSGTITEAMEVAEHKPRAVPPEVFIDEPIVDETDQQLSKQAARALVFTTPHVFRTLASLRKDLLKATANGYSDRVRELLDRDDVLTFRDAFNENNGLTPLHYAVENKHHYILQMLLDVDSDLSAMSNKAETPLDTAIRTENVTATRMLREAHLNRALRETGLRSPAMVACSRSLRALVVKHSDSSSVNTDADSYADTSSILTMSLHGPIRVEVFQEDCGPWYDRHTLYRVTVTNERPRSSTCVEVDANEYSVFKRFKDFLRLHDSLMEATLANTMVSRETIEALQAAKPAKIFLARFRVSTASERATMFTEMLRVAAKDRHLNEKVIKFMGL